MARCGEDRRTWLCFPLYVIVVGCIFPSVPSEIIIPRRLEQGTGKVKKEELSYIIKAAGKEHTIRLKQKNKFVVENLPVFTYDSEGRKVKSHPHIPAECYYEGYVEDMTDSLVALSICFGLRGFLKFRDLGYGIEPLEGSRTFQHLLYLTNGTGSSPTVCGLKADNSKHQAEVRRRKSDFRFATQPLYIELYIVVDNNMFRYEGSNETRVIHVILDTVNMVYVYYHSLNVDVTLVGLTIWKQHNLIETSSNGTVLIENFNEWKTAHSEEVHRDATHLFIHQRFNKEPWESYLGGICNPNISVGIDPYLNRDLVEFSKIVSHMLGHNIGLDHDGPHCFCDEQTSCIMHGFWAKFAMFSNCSTRDLSRLRTSRQLDCLRNVPPSTFVFKFKGCGNKVVDEGEQCDCGAEEQCRRDPCCHPNCTFKAKAVCAKEGCCKNCKIARKGILCRASSGVCDLPEYCTGKAIWCPEDRYKQDGTVCMKDAYCYAKKCLSPHLQCADIFGQEARAASLSCFRTLNMIGDEIGNCGGDGKGEDFVKCKEENVQCGRLHCSNVRKELDPLAYTHLLVNGEFCWSIKYQQGHGIEDTGSVPDGTRCNRKKICMNRTCVPVSILKPKCDPVKKCNGRGFCNNHNHCHCHFGWAPPDCKHFGAGGSVDSGYPTHAFTAHLFSFAIKVVIPAVLVGVALVTFFWSKLGPWISQHRPRLSCWR